MYLRSAPASPYSRKVKIAINLLKLDDQIEITQIDTNDATSPLRAENPLGKIPALALKDGTSFYDSRVIVDYLDHLAGGDKIIPTESKAKYETLRLQALADGICDAALAIVYEGRYRTPEMRVESWVALQQGKIDRAIAHLEAHLPNSGRAMPTIGEIATACALGYLDLRLAGKWREHHPKLVAWLDRFAASHPVFEKTKVVP